MSAHDLQPGDRFRIVDQHDGVVLVQPGRAVMYASRYELALLHAEIALMALPHLQCLMDCLVHIKLAEIVAADQLRWDAHDGSPEGDQRGSDNRCRLGMEG